MNFNKTVATNKLQQQFKSQRQDSVRTSEWAKNSVECVILRVFDEPGSNPLRGKEGDERLYAEVVTKSLHKIIIPFRDSPSQVISTYGNGEQLKNKKAAVEFYNNSLKHGKIVFTNHKAEKLESLSESTMSYSIGGIL